VIYIKKDIEELKNDETKSHRWKESKYRLKNIARIRQKSIEFCRRNTKAEYYFVVDCDNWIVPATLKNLIEKNVRLIAPMLNCIGNYRFSNFFITKYAAKGTIEDLENMINSREYKSIVMRCDANALHPVDVIHNTYLMKRDVLSCASYLGKEDNSIPYGIFFHFFQDIADESLFIQKNSGIISSIFDIMKSYGEWQNNSALWNICTHLLQNVG
jgi:hypothetical protein